MWCSWTDVGLSSVRKGNLDFFLLVAICSIATKHQNTWLGKFNRKTISYPFHWFHIGITLNKYKIMIKPVCTFTWIQLQEVVLGPWITSILTCNCPGHACAYKGARNPIGMSWIKLLFLNNTCSLVYILNKYWVSHQMGKKDSTLTANKIHKKLDILCISTGRI